MYDLMDNTREYDTGDLIGKYKPYVYNLLHDELPRRCDNCFKLSSNLLRCSICKISNYCDKNCQKYIWKFHKNECSFLRQYYSRKKYPSFLFLFIRLITKLKMDKDIIYSEMVFGKKRLFNDLIADIDEIKKNSEKMDEYNQIVSFITTNLNKEFNPEDLFLLFCKLCVNSFSILDEQLCSIGLGLYVGGSIFNHSCCSNATSVFAGNELTVRALRKINKGEDITISYIEQMLPTHIRRQKLLNHYLFNCNCEMCLNAHLTKEMSIIYCMKNKSNYFYTDNTGTLIANNCNHDCCRNILNIVEAVDNYEKSENNNLMAIYRDLTKKFSAIANQRSYYSFVYHRYALDLCVKMKENKLAVQHGKVLVEYLRQFLGDCNPHLAIISVIVGKVQVNNNLPEAIKYIKMGKDILAIIHGSENGLTLLVNDILNDCMRKI